MSLSSDKSATNFSKRAFSRSISLKRLGWGGLVDLLLFYRFVQEHKPKAEY
jgi:hypothetical protein